MQCAPALVQAGDRSEEDDNEGQAVEVKVTVDIGLDDLTSKILEKDKGSERVWEGYLGKRKAEEETRKIRLKNSLNDESDGEPVEHPGEFF